jgi:hypothetical protein
MTASIIGSSGRNGGAHGIEDVWDIATPHMREEARRTNAGDVLAVLNETTHAIKCMFHFLDIDRNPMLCH